MPRFLIATVCVTFVFLNTNFLETSLGDSVDLSAARDNTLYDAPTDLSNGAGDFFFVGRTCGRDERRGLLLFDLSPIPVGATINSVSLELVVSQANATTVDIGLHRLFSDWGESTSDAPGGEGAGTAAEVGDATWQHTFFPGSFWNTAGGDFASTASANQFVDGPATYTWQSSQLASDVQGWLDGTVDNFGWALVTDATGSGTAKRFNSRENNSGSPILRVDFTAVPEPTCVLVLSAIACVTSLRRKR